MSFTKTAALIAWAGSYFMVWQVTVSRTLEIYANLPDNPPDCYIATAAANGHPKFVKSHTHQTRFGQPVAVNQQLQTLKAAEIMLKAAVPRLHRQVDRDVRALRQDGHTAVNGCHAMLIRPNGNPIQCVDEPIAVRP